MWIINDEILNYTILVYLESVMINGFSSIEFLFSTIYLMEIARDQVVQLVVDYVVQFWTKINFHLNFEIVFRNVSIC